MVSMSSLRGSHRRASGMGCFVVLDLCESWRLSCSEALFGGGTCCDVFPSLPTNHAGFGQSLFLQLMNDALMERLSVPMSLSPMKMPRPSLHLDLSRRPDGARGGTRFAWGRAGLRQPPHDAFRRDW